MTFIAVMIVNSAPVNIKVHALTIWIVDYEESVTVTIICYSELVLDIIQCQNVGDYLLIKPYLTTPFYISSRVVLMVPPYILTIMD